MILIDFANRFSDFQSVVRQYIRAPFRDRITYDIIDRSLNN